MLPNLEDKAQVRDFSAWKAAGLILEAATPWGVIRNTWTRTGARS